MHLKRALVGLATAAVAATTLTAVTSSSAQAASVPLSGTGVLRIAGSDRFATAVKVSQKTFKAPQSNVVIASGDTWPDALAAGPYAAYLDAPVLLVRKNSVPSVVVTELKRLKAAHMYVIGGSGAVSNGVMEQLANYVGSGERVFGKDRYATAGAVLDRMDGLGAVYVASGATYADVLAGGAAAAAEGGGLVLTPPTSLAATAARGVGRTNHVVILGGTGAVSAKVESQIRKAAPGATVDRADGADRYETAAIVADALWGDTGSDLAFYASGSNFPDALGAAPAAFVNDAPVLLTRGTCTPKPTAFVEDELAPSLGVFLGGTTVTYSGARVC